MFYFIKEWWFLIGATGGIVYGAYKGIKTINQTLIEIKNELKMSNERFILSEKDRKELWKKAYKHDDRLNQHEIMLNRHDIYISKLRGL